LLENNKRNPTDDSRRVALFYLLLSKDLVLVWGGSTVKPQRGINLLAGTLLAGCSDAIPGITHVYAFGDDFSNTNNCLKLFREAVAQGQFVADDLKNLEENWEGRLSNGPVAAEILAERLQVGLTDYAVCAATSGRDNLLSDIDSL